MDENNDDVKRLERRELLLAGAALLAASSTASSFDRPEGKPKPTNASRNSFVPKQLGEDLASKRKKPISPTVNEKTSEIEKDSGYKIDFGRDPTKDRQLREYFGLELNDKIKPERLLDRFSKIDSQFSFIPNEWPLPFNRFHIEVLLSTAGQDIDKGLNELSIWQEKASLAANLGLEMLHYLKLDEVHRAEEAAGFYDVSSELAISDRVSEEITASLSKAAYENLDNLLKQYQSLEQINKQLTLSQFSAWLGALPHNAEPNVGNDLTHSGNGFDAKPTFEHMKDIAFDQGMPHHLASQIQLAIQSDQQEFQNLAAEARLKAKIKKENWELKDKEFRSQRTQIARNLAQIKLQAATEKGGALNFVEQMLPIQDRFNRNLSDAVIRIDSANQGLCDLFDFPINIPRQLKSVISSARSGDNVNGAKVGLFDEALIWVRNAQTWYEALMQREQSYIFSLSIRSLFAEESWKQTLTSGNWSFELEEDHFPEQHCIRLKGISCSVIGGKKDDIWLARILPPRQARHRTPSGKRVNLTQSHISPIRIGRIQTRDSVREPDAVGIISLHNASPIGEWDLSFSPVSRTNDHLSELEDIVLDLHIGYFSR
ncbi:hypothetical protein [Methylicorpusculum sp.]|uniref:hypothetical protein n=1 Tax=Methylicorpusculum sp. TaxID=2713644 RepID=UPI00271BCB0D|nr:hypothetical protein [Methylicorpusculum sp.]MDO8846539.1 hypothetical protein [Methylicorpusculum sp.]